MVSHAGLADSVLMTSHISTRALVATAVNGTAVDMQGWDGCAFLVQGGVPGTNATLDGLVQRDDNSGFNSPANIANSNLTQIVNGNGIAVIDVYQPSERYVRLQLTGQTNGFTAGAVAIQYRRTGVLPPTQTLVQYIKVVNG